MDSLGDITTTTLNSQHRHRRTSVEFRRRYYEGLEVNDENSPPRKMERHPRFMASTSASQAKTTPPQLQSRPTTPAPLVPGTAKSSAWISNLGKRVGVRSKTRKHRPSHSTVPITGSKTPEATQSRDFQIHEDPMNLSPWPVPEPTRRIPARRGSPPNKPLPSLPIATLAADSPKQRRSLIDAQEKTLRRSVSPLPGVLTGDEWPVLNPSPANRVDIPHLAEPYESKIPFMVAHPRSKASSQSHERDIVSTPALPAMKSTSSTPSSLSIVRQTKTSMLRAELSGGQSGAHGQDKRHVSSPVLQYFTAGDSNASQSPLEPTFPPGPGPVRTLSRTKRLITDAGSPFGHVRNSPSHARLVDIKKKRTIVEGQNAGLPSPTESSFSEDRTSVVVPDAVVVKEIRLQPVGDKKSALPLPTRLLRSSPAADSEGEVKLNKKSRRGFHEHILHHDHSDDGDIDTDNDGKIDEGKDTFSGDVPDPSSNGRAIAPPDSPQTTPESFTTPASSEPGYAGDVDTSTRPTRMYDFDDFESFKVKYLSVSSPNHGPTLRVSSAADRLIMGTGESEAGEIQQEASRRVSVPDLRRSVVLKESIRKSLRGAIPLSRSLTYRSLSRASQVADEESGGLPLFTQNGAVSIMGNVDRTDPPNEVGMRSRDSFMSFIEHGGVSDRTTMLASLTDDHSDWPMKKINTLTTTTRAVSEEPVNNDDSWISPLPAKPGRSEPPTENEVLPTPGMSVPNNSSLAVNPSPFTSNDWQRYSSSDLNKATDVPSVRQHAVTLSPTNAVPRYALPTRNSSLRDGPVKVGTVKSPNRSDTKSTNPGTTHTRPSIFSAMPVQNTIPTPPGPDIIEALRTINPESELQRTSKFIEASSPRPKVLPLTPTTSTPRTLLSNFRRMLGKRSKDNLRPSRSASNFGPKRHFRDSLAHPYSPSPLGRVNESQNSVPVSTDSVPGTSPVRRATDTAMKVMDLATKETDLVKRDEMIELARMLVNSISSAKDAEKSMEEARQAALKAEGHALEAKRAVGVLAEMVGIVVHIED